jgi:hypothetical protein
MTPEQAESFPVQGSLLYLTRSPDSYRPRDSVRCQASPDMKHLKLSVTYLSILCLKLLFQSCKHF